jgi:hypothetical protein
MQQKARLMPKKLGRGLVLSSPCPPWAQEARGVYFVLHLTHRKSGGSTPSAGSSPPSLVVVVVAVDGAKAPFPSRQIDVPCLLLLLA